MARTERGRGRGDLKETYGQVLQPAKPPPGTSSRRVGRTQRVGVILLGQPGFLGPPLNRWSKEDQNLLGPQSPITHPLPGSLPRLASFSAPLDARKATRTDDHETARTIGSKKTKMLGRAMDGRPVDPDLRWAATTFGWTPSPPRGHERAACAQPRFTAPGQDTSPPVHHASSEEKRARHVVAT
jgi:hypothetical protein